MFTVSANWGVWVNEWERERKWIRTEGRRMDATIFFLLGFSCMCIEYYEYAPHIMMLLINSYPPALIKLWCVHYHVTGRQQQRLKSYTTMPLHVFPLPHPPLPLPKNPPEWTPLTLLGRLSRWSASPFSSSSSCWVSGWECTEPWPAGSQCWICTIIFSLMILIAHYLA